MSSSTTSDLPPGFTEAIDPKTGKKYYIDHNSQTSSFANPNQEPYTPGLPYPYERLHDDKGRAYYTDHEKQTTSWMNPVKLAELKSSGILDAETDEYSGEDRQAWKAWVIGDVAGEGEYKGMEYWVNYRTGIVEWQSPEDKRIGKEAADARRAARIAAEKS
ncbi:hypothetical protein B0O99DRAFT_603905 [Bisporella sp. PMI_857]|jgi:hypothetical protein|nr:hypothetical protein B0O99DRAFT_603905 [Bisporella sp. PMI_857]